MDGQNQKEDKFGLKDDNAAEDHRYLPRWEVANRVLFNLDSDNREHECVSRDLSCSGACLVIPETINPKQKIVMKIYLSKEETIDISGEIVWIKPELEGNLVGVDFEATTSKVREAILNHAFEIKKEDLVNHWFKGWNK